MALDNLPGVAQPAIQEGKYVAKVIKPRLAGAEAAVRPFEYFDKGTVATIGHNSAVAEAFGPPGRRSVTGGHAGTPRGEKSDGRA